LSRLVEKCGFKYLNSSRATHLERQEVGFSVFDWNIKGVMFRAKKNASAGRKDVTLNH